MKTFQKIALVSAIAAAPFAAQADLTPMDDSLMGNTTGQAGVTIEIDLGNDGIGIGSVVYTDTANTDTTDGGTVTLENINIGLTGVLTQTIDVSENGDLVMGMTMPDNTVMSISAGVDAADTTGAFSALKLGAAGDAANASEIINNLSLNVALGDSTTTIMNLGGYDVTVPAQSLADRSGPEFDSNDPAYDQTAVDAADAADAANAADIAAATQNNALAAVGLGTLSHAGVIGSYANDVSSMAIKMTASAKVSDMNVGLFGYTKAQAAVLSQSPGAPAADEIAKGSAIQLSGVSITDANSSDGMFTVNQVIWAVGGDASQAGSKAGVYIQMGAMDLDIGVEGVGIGGSSIGSLAVNNLQMNGLTQRIYGH